MFCVAAMCSDFHGPASDSDNVDDNENSEDIDDDLHLAEWLQDMMNGDLSDEENKLPFPVNIDSNVQIYEYDHNANSMCFEYEEDSNLSNSQNLLSFDDLSPAQISDPEDTTYDFTLIPQHRGPGRPKTCTHQRRSCVQGQDIYFEAKLSGRKTYKLWEFLRNLLLDERTCPSLIKWHNFDEGTFKFVQSDKVAQLWGNRKNNSRMNYEKLSRAMRYYYRSKVLLPVPGKRLVYQFGPNATGWRTTNPILQ